jgi:hypothetical protein
VALTGTCSRCWDQGGNVACRKAGLILRQLLYSKLRDMSQVLWYMPVIPTLRRQRQEDEKFKASLGYIMRPYLKINKQTENLNELALVAHTCNPSYLGDRGQEDHSSKPAWANSS